MILKPFIEIQFDADIWKMQIDEMTDTICLELRNAENKSVSFSTVNIQTAEVYFKELQFLQDWFCGLSAASNGVMLVHGYQSETLPIPKGLTAVDETSGKILWEDHNLNLEKIHQTDIEVYDVRIQPKKPGLIKIKDRTPITSGDADFLPLNTHIKYPNVPDDYSISGLELPMGAEPGGTLFIQDNGFRILSLHAFKNGATSQHLRIYNKSGEMLYEDIIARHIQKLQPEAFIVYKNKLIWIKERSVLKVIDL